MKKKLALLLVTSLLLSIALCGCADDVETEPEQDEEEQQVMVNENGEELGSGLVQPEVTSALDENPNRAIRRSAKPTRARPATTTAGQVLGDEHYFYRNTLTDHGKKAYDVIRSGLMDGKSSINMTVPISVDDAFTIYQMVVYDGPDLFYATNACSVSYNNSGNVTTLTPTYNELVYDIQGATRQLQEATAQAVADMRALGEPLYQVKYAHDYLTNTVNYVMGAPHNQNCFSALVMGETVCAGYAHALQYLLQQVDIPCAYVVGNAGEPHAWNILELYGEVYAMDVTWDDPLGNAPDRYYYNYFNITDDQLSRDHARDGIAQPLPWATGTQCSYENGFGGNAYGTDFSAIGGDPSNVVPTPGPSDNGGDDGEWWDEWEDGDGTNDGWDDSGEDWDDSDWDDTGDDWDDSGWDDDTSWDDWYDDWEDDSSDQGWWNLLDDSWTIDDWEDMGDGAYMIYDEETLCFYIWEESEGMFYAMDGETEEMFMLDMDSGEWIPAG